MNTPESPQPDGKDWTWVITGWCPECGFDPATVDPPDRLADALAGAAPRWIEVLRRPDCRERPAPTTWSPLEYAAHVRDVYEIFTVRTRLLLDSTEPPGPTFANWDQDATALQKRYWDSDPARVRDELTRSAADAAALYGSVAGSDWDRQGYRSNGSVFTVRTLGVYFLHDVLHHLHDVRG